MTQSPKNIKSDLKRPGSELTPSLNSLDFLQECQDRLAGEDTFKGVLKKFVDILAANFQLESVAYLSLPQMSEESGDKKRIVKFPLLKAISDEECQNLSTKIAAALAVDHDLNQGRNHINVNGKVYSFTTFVEPNGAIGLLVWTQQGNGESIAQNESPMISFLTRQVQHTCSWLRRLDNTQALLYQDEVTGLYNYRYLDVALDGELRRLQRFHAPFSLLFIDLDDFKKVNDLHGHLTGSSVLRQVGETIKIAVRDVDSVIRYGGDEFVVVLIGATSRHAVQAAERVRSKVAESVYRSQDRSPIKLTVSVGVASCPEHGKDKQSILKLADETMYQSKKNGKNRVMTVTSSEQARKLTTRDPRK